MKITKIEVINKNINDKTSLVQIQTDTDIVGIGATASPVPVIKAIIELMEFNFSRILKGADPTDPSFLWDEMYRVLTGWGRYGDGGYIINAMAAIDMALWDIASKARKIPLYKLLGKPEQTKIMVYASTSRWDRLKIQRDGEMRLEGQSKSIDDIVLECNEHISAGFKAIKFGWGNYFNKEAEDIIAAMRESVGPDIKLMLDYGCPAYLSPDANVKKLTEICDMLGKYDIYFLEEPLNPHDTETFALLTSISPIKIATGESLTTLVDLKRFIDNKALDIIQPDAQQIGITWFLEVMKLCESSGILCIPHCPWTSIAVAAHLNILCTSSSPTMIEYPAFASFEKESDTSKQTHAMHNSITDFNLQVEDGYLAIPKQNGLGLGNYLNNFPATKPLPRNNDFGSQ